jgi:hypothetical protein
MTLALFFGINAITIFFDESLATYQLSFISATFTLIFLLNILIIFFLFKQKFNLIIGFSFLSGLLVLAFGIYAGSNDEDFIGGVALGFVLATLIIFTGLKLKKSAKTFFSVEKLNHSQILQDDIRLNAWVILLIVFTMLYANLGMMGLNDIGYFEEFTLPIALVFAIDGPLLSLLCIVSLIFVYNYNYKNLKVSLLIAGILSLPLGVILLAGRIRIIKLLFRMVKSFEKDPYMAAHHNFYIREILVNKGN